MSDIWVTNKSTFYVNSFIKKSEIFNKYLFMVTCIKIYISFKILKKICKIKRASYNKYIMKLAYF